MVAPDGHVPGSALLCSRGEVGRIVEKLLTVLDGCMPCTGSDTRVCGDTQDWVGVEGQEWKTQAGTVAALTEQRVNNTPAICADLCIRTVECARWLPMSATGTTSPQCAACKKHYTTVVSRRRSRSLAAAAEEPPVTLNILGVSVTVSAKATKITGNTSRESRVRHPSLPHTYASTAPLPTHTHTFVRTLTHFAHARTHTHNVITCCSVHN